MIDTNPPSVVATIPVGAGPEGVAVTPDGKHAYVANVIPSGDGTVSVIDTATNTVVATVTLPVGASPTGIAVAPDGKHAYVTTNRGTVSVIDTASNTVLASILVGGITDPAWGVAVTPDGTHIYVVSTRAVRVIDVATNPPSLTATVPVGRLPPLVSPSHRMENTPMSRMLDPKMFW